MPHSKQKVYYILLITCLGGYLWLGFNFFHTHTPKLATPCLFKQVTRLPCPSCGATRSIISLFHGEIKEAIFTWNPLGFLILLVMVVTPFWILHDSLFKKDSLFYVYQKAEKALAKKVVYIPAIIFILLLWIWNIYKGI